MLRCALARARPLAACARGIQQAPHYQHPGDVDPVADRKFDEEFGIKETLPEKEPDPFEDFAPVIDGWWRFKLRIWKFFGDNLPYRQTEAEVEERKALTDRLHAYYETIPQSYPDAAWWHDIIDHYVKFNDYDGARKMWHWLVEQRIDVDDEVLDKFERFFYENDSVGLRQKSIVQQLRSNSEHLPDRFPDALMRREKHGA